MVQKYIMGWKVGLEAEMGFLASEAKNEADGIGHGKLLWEPLPVTNVNDGSV